MDENEKNLKDELKEMERKYRSVVNALKARSSYQGEIVRALYEKYGREGLQLVEEVYRKRARTIFPQGIKNFNITGRGAIDFIQFFYRSGLIMYPTFKVEIAEGSNERKASVRYYGCPFWTNEEAPKIKGGYDICNAFFGFEREASLIFNPRLKVYYSMLLTKGDPWCEITAELEE
jgi:hypothetical protein